MEITTNWSELEFHAARSRCVMSDRAALVTEDNSLRGGELFGFDASVRGTGAAKPAYTVIAQGRPAWSPPV